MVYYPGVVGHSNNMTFAVKPTLEQLKQDVATQCAQLRVSAQGLEEAPRFDLEARTCPRPNRRHTHSAACALTPPRDLSSTDNRSEDEGLSTH